VAERQWIPNDTEHRMIELVWIFEERTYGQLMHYGATHSLVRYESGGLDIEEWLENDEFELRSERAFEYEADDE
jgi:hypothetical protein